MEGALFDEGGALQDFELGEVGEVGLKIGEGGQQVGVFRAAGAAEKLLGAVSFEDEQTARPESLDDVVVEGCSIRRGNVKEDRSDEIEGFQGPVPGAEVALLGLKRDAALGGQIRRLGETDGGEIDGEDVEALLGEPDAVASFAVGDAERIHSGVESVRVAFEVLVGLGAEDEFCVGITLIPQC